MKDDRPVRTIDGSGSRAESVGRGAATVAADAFVRTFRRYQTRLLELGRLDEPASQLAHRSSVEAARTANHCRGWRSAADREVSGRRTSICSPVCSRCDALTLCNRGQLAAGFHERVHQVLPESKKNAWLMPRSDTIAAQRRRAASFTFEVAIGKTNG
jgi:hypothetical protein